MQIEPQVTFHGVPVSDAVRHLCWTEAGKLERFSDRITSCRIVVSEPHRRHRHGNHYSIRIDLTLPGGEVVVNREAPEHQADEDIAGALREAFDTARRRLQDFVARRKGRPDIRERSPEGTILRMDELGGFGFLTADDGREVYFHRSSVHDVEFEQLEVQQRVRFGEEIGEAGPQATWVRPAGPTPSP